MKSQRLYRLRQKLNLAGADALIISETINQSWLCGFDYTDGYLLVLRDGAYIITDSRYAEAARAAVCGDFEVLLGAGGKAPEVINGLLGGASARTLAFEDRAMPYAEAKHMENVIKAALVPAGGMLDDLREYKDADELDAIRRAQKITDMAFSNFLETARPDMTETEVATELEFFLRRHGATGRSFDFITVSGEASSLPHGVPKDRVLRRGFLTLDFGCVVDGYCSDMTRTVCVGPADAEMKKLYNCVFRAQQAALAVIKDGMLCSEVDAAARNVTEAEYPGAFGHGLGHGVGRFIHEAPRLSPRTGDARLAPGHVVTVEPGIYLEGKYGCRIEDMVFITPGGAEDITASRRDLIELF